MPLPRLDLLPFAPANLSRLCTLLVALSAAQAQAPPSRPPITGVAHIALLAHDVNESRDFYRTFLGFEEPYTLRKPDGSPSMLFFKINDRQYIELSPEREAGTDRLSHIALETDDAEAMRAYLASRGVAVPASVPKGRIGNLNFMIKDPQGHSVEIVQYAGQSWTVRERGKHMPADRISQHMMHAGIIVNSLESEMKFYTEVLGFQEIWRGSSNGKVLSWVNLRVPEGRDYIEFMLYKESPAPTERGSAHHLCLEVPDIEASLSALNAKPYRARYSRPLQIRTGTNHKRQLNLFDPDGTRTELMEPVTVDGKPAPPSEAPPPAP
jgi:catechol 2,3-dioxygenase-like lactoylglutathione lyase family enzyme